MSLNKKKMVREIGRRTRLKNRDVQAVIETLVDVWTEELVAGGRIEIENFIVLSIKTERLKAFSGDNETNVEKHSCSKVLSKLEFRIAKKLRPRLNLRMEAIDVFD